MHGLKKQEIQSALVQIELKSIYWTLRRCLFTL